MKTNYIKFISLAFCFILSINAMGQATSLTVDNQTPGLLSSKIGYGDQQTVERLKVTGYINGTDYNFLGQLVDKNLKALDLEDANIVEGGDPVSSYQHTAYGTVYVYIKADQFGGYYNENFKFSNLRWLATPKTAIYKRSLENDTLIVHSKIGRLPEYSYETFALWKKNGQNNTQKLYVAIGEGIKDFFTRHEYSSTYSTNTIYYSGTLVLPSTIESIDGLYVNGKVISNIENPESVTLTDCNFQCKELWIPEGTMEKYLSTSFKTAQNIYEMAPPKEISIDNSKLKLYKGESALIQASLIPENAYYNEVVWMSSDASIASVSQFGEVAAINAGTAEVTISSAKRPEVKSTCTVNVYEHTTGVSLSSTNETLNIGSQLQLSASTLPAEISDNEIIWSSSNSEIATVDEAGNVSALKVGTCTIKATSVDGGLEEECIITVVQPASKVNLTKHNLTVRVGETETLTAIVVPDNTTDKSLTWTSSNIDVAEVDANGLVIAKKAGKATITATAVSNSEAKDECEVTVIQPVTGIQLSETKVTMSELGEMKQLVATVLPEDASNKAVTWMSSDPSVCSVTSNGTIVAMGYGTTTIMATTVDGGFPAVCVVQVASYVVGDINGDDKVDVSDYTGIANFIHGNPPAGFNEKAADVDKNGTVDVSDYTGIANIIHTGSIYGSSSNSARATGNQPTADWDAKDNVIFIAPFTATAGTKTSISIEMKNTAAIRGFQFDLYLPEGITVVKSAKGKIQGKLSEGRLPDEDEHDLTFSQQPDGAIRFLCSSQYDETFTGTSGELATLQVEIASDMANGEYAIQLKNMKLTETDISKYYTSDLIESTVTIGGESSGIIVINNEQLTNDNEAGVYYTIDGRRLTSKPAKSGLYIKNGKKVVIK